jgi:hypothetical protein
MDNAPSAQPGKDSAEFRAAAAASVAPDPQTAELLAKHSAGEKLTPQQYGKVGAFAAQLKRLNPFGKVGAAGGPVQPGAAPGNPAAVAAIPPGQTSPDGLELVPVDASIARRTASAIINRIDPLCVNWLTREAKAAGATDKTLDRFRTAAGFSVDDKKLLTDLAPDICSELGINPRKFALWTALGVVGMHGVNLWLCVDELRTIRKEQATKDTPAATSEPARVAVLPGPFTVVPKSDAPTGAPKS